MSKKSNYTLKSFFRDFVRAVKGDEKNFLEGSIRKAIFMLSIPMILEMLMESLFAIVDIYFVGKVSVNAIATVTLTESVIMIIFAIAIGMSMAATAIVARRVGEKKMEDASKAAGQVIILTLAISSVFSIIGILYAPEILTIMGGEPELIAEGQGYTRILIGGNYTIMFLFLINAVFRGAGDASVAMRSLWLANGLNIILDPIFIFGWGPVPAFGVEGAAIATTIGRGCGVLYQFYSLYNKKSILNIRISYFKPDWPLISKIVKVSLGGIGQFMIGTMSWMFMVRISAEFGSQVLAGYALAFRTIMFTILPAWGMSNAAATLVGQNLGAKQPDRAEKTVWKTAWYNAYFLIVVSLVFVFLSEPIIRIFNSDPVVIEIGSMALMYIGFGYVFYAFGMVIGQAFNGAGDTRTPTIINFICFWLFEIPVAYFLAFPMKLGPNGLFTAIALSAVLMGFISIYLFRKGNWKQIEV